MQNTDIHRIIIIISWSQNFLTCKTTYVRISIHSFVHSNHRLQRPLI